MNEIKKILLKSVSTIFLGLTEIEPMKEGPLVSVIIPNYNYAWCVGDAIDSVINQSYKNWELLIVDDCSSDNSVSLIKKKLTSKKINVRNRIVFIRNMTNLGLIKSYQKALLKARGKYVAFVDADDCWQQDNLKFKVSVLEKFSNLALVYSRYTEFQNDYPKKHFYQKIPLFPSKKSDSFFFRHKIFSFSLVLVRKDLFENIDFSLPKKYAIFADWWAYVQILQKWSIAKIPLELVAKRIHKNRYTTRFFSKTNYDKFSSEFKELLRNKFLKIPRFYFVLLDFVNWLDWSIRKIILKVLKDRDFF